MADDKNSLAIALAAFAMLAGGVVIGAKSIHAEDDWQVIERHTTNAPADTSAGAAPAAKAAGGALVACGEAARPAGEPYKTIVAQLNDMWGTNFPVYESLRAGSPHASSGGCIFYNQQFLDSLFQRWMR